jgi:hypothetical protein
MIGGISFFSIRGDIRGDDEVVVSSTRIDARSIPSPLADGCFIRLFASSAEDFLGVADGVFIDNNGTVGI